MFVKSFFKKRVSKWSARISRGFTLMEMIIVVAIIGLITTIALANQSSLSNNVLLSNLSYEIGLSLREAQTYGISVKAGDSSEGFRGGYGILFRSDMPEEYYLFHDFNDNKFPDEADGEIVDTYKIQNQRGNQITRLCFAAPCNVSNEVEYMTIIFRRPNPEPIFQAGTVQSGGNLDPDPAFTSTGAAYIVVNNRTNDNCKTIVVEQTGQIRVDIGTPKVCEN